MRERFLIRENIHSHRVRTAPRGETAPCWGDAVRYRGNPTFLVRPRIYKTAPAFGKDNLARVAATAAPVLLEPRPRQIKPHRSCLPWSSPLRPGSLVAEAAPLPAVAKITTAAASPFRPREGYVFEWLRSVPARLHHQPQRRKPLRGSHTPSRRGRRAHPWMRGVHSDGSCLPTQTTHCSRNNSVRPAKAAADSGNRFRLRIIGLFLQSRGQSTDTLNLPDLPIRLTPFSNLRVHLDCRPKRAFLQPRVLT